MGGRGGRGPGANGERERPRVPSRHVAAKKDPPESARSHVRDIVPFGLELYALCPFYILSLKQFKCLIAALLVATGF